MKIKKIKWAEPSPNFWDPREGWGLTAFRAFNIVWRMCLARLKELHKIKIEWCTQKDLFSAIFVLNESPTLVFLDPNNTVAVLSWFSQYNNAEIELRESSNVI